MQQAHRQWERGETQDHRSTFPHIRTTHFRPLLELPESKREANQEYYRGAKKRNQLLHYIKIVTHLLTASRETEQLQCRNAGQNIEGQGEPESRPEPLVLCHIRSVPEGSHGLEIRGSEVPTVQGTEDL